MDKAYIGQSRRRTEDFRFLTGQGQYIDDINLDAQVYATALRSPYAHANILNIDATAALELTGVLLVVTGDDWIKQGFGPIPTKSVVRENRDGTPLAEPPHHCLAINRARHVGEIIAFVVAETRPTLLDALEMIEVEYQALDSVTDPVAAIADGAPLIWEGVANNICVDYELGDAEATQAAFDVADHVVALDVINNRVTAVPMEPRGAIGVYNPTDESYLLYNSSQNIHANRDTFAEKVLNIPKDKLRHVAPDVGGGFGVKNGVYPEPALVLYAAKYLGRPVKWINDRSESFQSDTHGRDQVSKVELALDADGTFRALRTETIGDLGAYCATVGPFTPTGGSARTQGGPYSIGAMYYRSRAVFTNTAMLDPYRGAGRPEAAYQIERIVEFAARELGFDPIELRRKNLIPRSNLPMKTPMGLDVDCGDFPEVFELTLKMTDRDGYPERLSASVDAGRLRGFAIAPYLECTGGGPKEFTRLTFNADGTSRLEIGSHSTGMGHETAMPQIAAAHLGIPAEGIEFVQGDTSATPFGGGHGGSRGLEVGGNSVLQAAAEVIEKGKVIAAHMFGIASADVDFEDGSYVQPATNHTATMAEVIEASHDPARLPDGVSPGHLTTESTFERGIISIPNGCHAAEVEVDPETGCIEITGYWVVDDFGVIVNPMLADGQVMGGVAQGIGQAIFEQIVYDPESGQLLSGSLQDYALPRSTDIPHMEIAYFEGAPTAKNALGVKGAGEAGCVGAPPAIVNAVLDAIKGSGTRRIDMPMTPERVWRALGGAGN